MVSSCVVGGGSMAVAGCHNGTWLDEVADAFLASL
jgi:hypothetical protein